MIAAVVLAAGSSSRMGRTKQLLEVTGRPMLEMVLTTLRSSGFGEVVVVLGSGSDEVRKKIRFEGEKVVVNRDHSEGLASSLVKGIMALDADAEAVVVVLGDQPLVSVSTIEALMATYRDAKAVVVAPYYLGRRGNPVLFDRRLFPELLKVQGDVGAKAVVEAHSAETAHVDVDDSGVLLDVDTPEDYDVIQSESRKRNQGAGGR